MPAEPTAIAAREAEIFSRPQRILPPENLSDEHRALAMPPAGHGRGTMSPNFAVMLHSPELAIAFKALGSYYLNHGQLPFRERELIILRMAWLCQSPFEWGEHVRIGHKVGLTTDEVERLTLGSTAPGWSEADHALVRAVEEMHANAMIAAETWDTLAAHFTPPQLIEIPLLAGQYQGLAYFLNSIGITPLEGNDGLAAR
ncbi:MAG: carboxymuconolactone decarboxylase family protein [Sphingomonadales bacterium]|nr:carboxymuconolactone decarboxylase family protein [Sphingomonadales bacterium]